MLLSLLKDIRFSLRSLARNPTFTAVALVILALGIGANVTVFSFVDSILLEPLDYPAASRLVQVWEYNHHTDERSWVYYGNFHDWRERSRTFDAFALYNLWEINVWGDPEPERVKTCWASANYFDLLGAQPQRGRTFLPEDEKIGNHRVAVISHGLWQRRFGGDSAAVGGGLRIAENLYKVVGVMPADFRHPGPPGSDQPELWIPSANDPSYHDHRSGYTWERAIGRVKPGVSLIDAQLDLDRVARELEAEYPTTNTHRGVVIEPLHHFVVGQLRSELRFLLLAVGLVLLGVCANLSSLVTVRSSGRRQEMAVRMALGARRGQLVRQLTLESLVLALAGGSLGILIAALAVAWIRNASLLELPGLGQVSLDATSLVFTLTVTLIGVTLFGLLPAAGSLRGDLHPHLKEASRGGGRRHNAWQQALVAAEVALALTLVLGAALLARSYQRILEFDPGIRPHGVLALDMTQTGKRYENKDERIRVWDELTERLLAQPGVEAVGGVVLLPLMTRDDTPTVYQVEGRQPAPAGQEPIAQLTAITTGYPDAMGLTVTEGRAFDQRDRAGATGVVMVNRTLARRAWPGQSAVGKRLRLPGRDDSWWLGSANDDWLTVVGVIGDVRLYGLDVEAVAQVYRPHAQDPWTTMNLIVRSNLEPSVLMSVIRREVRRIDPNQPLRHVATMAEAYDRSLARRRLLLAILAGFAAMTLVLAAVGIYGVMAWTVAQRRREIGLRMAVGARGGDILRMVLAQSGRLFLLGVAVGLPLAWLLNRALSAQLFEARGFDAMAFLVASGVLAMATLVASLVPSWRASRVDPLVALRHE